MGLLRIIKDIIGDSRGYSGCGICGDTWDWKEKHTVMYTPNKGVFVVCEECWKSKPDYEIGGAAEKLAAKRLSQGYSKEIREDEELMVAAVKKAASER
jgi:hypothetical protein